MWVLKGGSYLACLRHKFFLSCIEHSRFLDMVISFLLYSKLKTMLKISLHISKQSNPVKKWVSIIKNDPNHKGTLCILLCWNVKTPNWGGGGGGGQNLRDKMLWGLNGLSKSTDVQILSPCVQLCRSFCNLKLVSFCFMNMESRGYVSRKKTKLFHVANHSCNNNCLCDY